MSAKVDNFLAHYSSPYYDPVKAREYYLRNRELKGNQNSGLSAESIQKQSEANSYVRDQVKTKRTADLDANTTARDAIVAAYQARVTKIQGDVQTAREELNGKLEAKLKSIESQFKIPTNASPKLRAFMEKQKAKQTATAKGEFQAELQTIRSNVQSVIRLAREEYKTSRTANSTDRKAISDKYKKDLETETENIKNQVR